MAKSSQLKKEEKEYRSIVKQARVSQKKAKEQERSSKRREIRLRQRQQKDQENGSGDAGTSSSTTATPKTRKRRAAAIILPSQVAELRSRLSLSSSSSATPSKKGSTPSVKALNAEKAKKASAAKKNTSQEGRGSSSSTENEAKHTEMEMANPTTTTGQSPPFSTSSAIAVPNHHMELHVKHKMVKVDVILHHVPPQKINVSETTPTKLVVDTTGHSKKYRLELPMPKGVRVKVKDSTFEEERGVLQCRLPLANEEIPVGLQQEWEALQEKRRVQRAQRFVTSKDGTLTVRTRRALLPLSAKGGVQRRRGESTEAGEEKDTIPTTPATRKRQMETQESDAEEEAEGGRPTEMEKKGSASRHSSSSEAPQRENGAGRHAGAAAPSVSHPKSIAPGAGESAVKKTPTKVDAFKADQEKAKQLAKEASQTARLTIAEKVRAAQAVQEKRLEQSKVREKQRAVKDERREIEFQRILREQKEKVASEMTMLAGAEGEKKARLAEKEKAEAAGKSVRFE